MEFTLYSDKVKSKNMEDVEFDWFADVVEVESPVEEEGDQGPSALQSVFEFLDLTCKYAGTFFGTIFAVRYMLGANRTEISKVSVDLILLCLAVFTGSLPVIVYAVRILILVFRRLASDSVERKVATAYRWLALGLWFGTNIYLLRFVREGVRALHFHMHATLLCGLCTALTFGLCNIATEFLHEQFVRRNFFAKMVETDVRERILAAMKAFRCDVSESSFTQELECSCLDMLCLRDAPRAAGGTLRLNAWRAEGIGERCFRAPEVETVHDVKALAKDVYERAAGSALFMSFGEFSQIFADPELSVQAYSLFEPDEERRIPRKEFRDAVIGFFYHRLNFDKTMRIARNFTDTIGQIVAILATVILAVVCLIIFGVPLKELFAVALSSALLLNFMASGMAADMYYNIMLLVSHPFDVGDEVIVNGTEYRVYQTGLSNTSFLALNGGKVKIMNSELWKSNLMNMTRAPQKLLVFQFGLPDSLSSLKFGYLKIRIQQYLRGRPYDFFETFSLEARSEDMIDINTVVCNLVLRARSFQTKSRKFSLRLEINRFLTSLLEEIESIDNKATSPS